MFASLIYSRVLETRVDSTGQRNKNQNRNGVGFTGRKKRKSICQVQPSSAFGSVLLHWDGKSNRLGRKCTVCRGEGFNLPNHSRVVLFTFQCPRPPSWASLLTSKSPTVSIGRQRQDHSQTLGRVRGSYRRGGERSGGARRVEDTKGSITQSTNLGS